VLSIRINFQNDSNMDTIKSVSIPVRISSNGTCKLIESHGTTIEENSSYASQVTIFFELFAFQS
jgi:hypothetical protein